jgi:hypothetical protein
MAQAESKTTTPYPKHVQIWEHPERAPKIVNLPDTWLGHCIVHVVHALNELPPEARGTFIKDLGDFVAPSGPSGGTARARPAVVI